MYRSDILPLVRAALPAIPGVNRLPGIRKTGGRFAPLERQLTGVEVRRDAVDAYAAVCGFPRKDVAPLPYPHMLAFPLHMSLMADPGFPWPALGMVHLENSITAHRPIALGETLDLSVRAEAPRPHAKGALIDFRTAATVAGERVWESTSVYLRRGARVDGDPVGATNLTAPPPGTLTWQLDADLGRRYAAVSGDHNPIHLYAVTARALGFPRQIAHGMWSLARCVAALENRLPGSVRVDVVFKKPILLPGAVVLGHETVDDTERFGLTSPRDGSPHLVGAATPA